MHATFSSSASGTETNKASKTKTGRAMWKKVKLDGDIEGIENLLGIEVLENADTSKVERARKIHEKSSKSGGVGKVKKKLTKAKINTCSNVEPGKFVKARNETVEDDSFLRDMDAWNKHGIRKELLKALHDMGYLTPTKIQEKCIHGAITSKNLDIVGAAETGSGKTLAFGIPVVQQILDQQGEAGIGEDGGLSAVIITPTRELAVQVKDHLIRLCKYTTIRIALAVGGLAIEKQERVLNKNPEIVVGTPGRLWQLFNEKHPHIIKIRQVRMLVIDEADRMLEKKHFAELGDLLEAMNENKRCREARRNFVFSATLTLVHEPPSYRKGKKIKSTTKLKDLLSKIGVEKQLVYDLTAAHVTPETLSEWKLHCEFIEKDYYLVYFLKNHHGRCIVFCNSIGCVRRLANILQILKFKPLPLHANMEQKQRLRNLDKFRSDENSLLLATDVAARGLDIPKIGHVVHYQVPRTAESYVHRSGRTARGSNPGASLLLISIEETKLYRNLMRTLKRDSELESYIVSQDEFNHVKKLVNVARDIDSTSLTIKRSNSNEKWYSKAIEEMDIIVDEEELPTKATDITMKKIRRTLAEKENELKRLLSTPVVPHGFSGKFPDVNIFKSMPPSKKRRKR